MGQGRQRRGVLVQALLHRRHAWHQAGEQEQQHEQ
jgi:hypothetical protein